MESKKSAAALKHFRAMEKKKALSEAEQAKKAVQKKTAKLRELRLAKEAEERAAAAVKPKKKKAARRSKLPEFERDI